MQDEWKTIEKILFGRNADSLPGAQQLLRLMDQMPGGFFIYRADGNEEILYANDALLRIFGCTDMDDFRALTGATFPGLVHPGDIAAVEESIRVQVKQSQFDLDYVEYRIIRKDGEVRWLEDHGHFVQSEGFNGIFYVFASDATEKKRRQQQEREALLSENSLQEQRLRAYDRESILRQELIEGLSIDYESIFYVDLPSNQIHAYRLSKEAAPFFDGVASVRDYKDFIRAYINRWVHPEDRSLLTEALKPDQIRDCLQGHEVVHVNYRLLRFSQVTYMQLRIVNISKNPRISQIIIGVRSIDEEIRSEIEQKEFLANALHQAQSAVTAKNAFLSNMSHDMRTPLNAISGFTELAKRSANQPDKVLRYLSMIEVSSEQLLRLISNVLEIARIESGGGLVHQEPCDLREIVRRVRFTLLPQAAAKHLTLTINNRQMRHPLVYSDKHKVEEILFHLCSNAVKYTNFGGRVTVELSETDGRDGKNIYKLVVEDTGIGIGKEFLSHIFDLFSRENNTTVSGVHGSGLGLPITKSLVEIMGGSICVESEPGLGSRFIVTLPLRPQNAEPAEEAAPTPSALPPGEQKILVVEDNELNLEITLELLHDAGFKAEAATDGSIAVERIRNSKPGDYALVLMDIQMPVMDGCTAARMIRDLDDPLLSSIPIVALSANAFEKDRTRSLESGMDAHLPKPIDIDPLVDLIRRLTGMEAEILE